MNDKHPQQSDVCFKEQTVTSNLPCINQSNYETYIKAQKDLKTSACFCDKQAVGNVKTEHLVIHNAQK